MSDGRILDRNDIYNLLNKTKMTYNGRLTSMERTGVESVRVGLISSSPLEMDTRKFGNTRASLLLFGELS